MSTVIILALLALNIPIYKSAFKMIFRSKEDFNECLNYFFTPIKFSLLKGEYFKDRFYSLRVSFFMGVCCLILYIEYLLIKFFWGRFVI